MQKINAFFYLKSILLAFLAAFVFSVFGGLSDLFKGSSNYLAPWTFTSIWCLLGLSLSTWIAHKLCGSGPNFLVLALFTPIFALPFVLLLFLLTMPFFSLPATLESLKNYTGVSTGIYSDPESYYVKGELYFRDNQIVKAIKEMKNDNYSTQSFYTWQTGLAYGYLPNFEIKEYGGNEKFVDKFVLIFTVGPIFLAEKFIESLLMVPVYIFLQIGYYLKTKKQIWWSTDNMHQTKQTNV